jgi:hypothetical protein
VAETSCKFGSAHWAVSDSTAHRTNGETILAYTQKSLHNCTGEVDRGKDDAVEDVRGHGVHLKQCIFTNPPQDGGETSADEVEVVEAAPLGKEMSTALLLIFWSNRQRSEFTPKSVLPSSEPHDGGAVLPLTVRM